MNKEQLIALGLTEEQADKVVEGFGPMIPKSRFDEVNAAKKQLDTDLAARDTQLEELSKTAGASEELQAEIAKLQGENATAKEQYETQIKQIQIDNAVERALTGAKAKNIKAVKALLDLENVEFDGESIKGLDEQIQTLVGNETSSFLFESTTENNQQQFKGMKPGESKGNPTQTDPSKMTYTELTAYMAANPGVQI